MSLDDRYKLVRMLKLCYNCLKGKHFANNCRKPKACTVSDCNVKHNILLHSWSKPGFDHAATQPSVNCAATKGSMIKNCLGIIPVLVKGRNGNSCKTFALLDDGADKTLCDERLLQKLNIASKPVTFEMSTVSSSGSTIHGQEVDLQVKAIDGNGNVSLKKVWSVKKLPISARSAAENVDIRKLSYLADIQIPSTDLTEVMLLIGTDSPNAHIPLEVRSGNENQPYAIRSRLGWAIRGPIEDTHASNVINVHFEEARDVLLQRQLERMWTSDFDDRAREDKNGLSIEDKEAMKMMESSITQENGHFKLGLPWRDRETTLPNNMVLAHARLQQLKRKLSSNETLHKMYTTTVNDYIEKGYAKEVTNIESKSKRVWYLPHHPITNENKPGKVRVVFDCASNTGQRNVLDEELGISETDTEIKKEIAVHATTNNAIDNLLGYFSDWIKLRRAIAWFRRFKIYCRNRYLGHHLPCNSGNLNVTELREATDEILAHVQMSYFSDEITNLKKAKPVKKGSRIASLNPVLVNELIRSKGRLNYDLSTCPVILPNKHHVTTLIIRYYHETTGHVGKQQVLAASREKYWILKGSSAVKTVIDRCVPCKRQHGPFCKQQMAPLLEEQMTADKPPFTFVGVDYFGPLNVKLGRSVVKRYGCLFTCLTTRAVHIEIAHSLNTDSFISAFQRFTSRRGIPERSTVIMEQISLAVKSNFKKNIEQWNKATISNYMLHKDIIWTFNPPYASHRGGAWERMIRSTRNIFKALINQQLLSDEQLLTFMAETERIMNDRPITAISDDCRDLPVLTPNMLLLMKSNTSTPQGVFDKKDIYAKRWWKQIQHLANEFWKRWLREYLPTLQQRRKWQREERDVEIDDIVLVADERIQRGQWPLGRIVEVTRSRDGHIRSCVVKTSQSHILRPINKLCLLECSK
ncbi:unnamed protein product [Mytilus edulis]|nr:unnamed protein product [Mytilus edulis]